MLDILYNLFVYPLYVFIELIFDYFLVYTSRNIFLTMSIVSFILCLMFVPLSNALVTFNETRINSYNRLIIFFKNYSSLILHIISFIAIYTFFSGLEVLNGFQFGLISDLSKPDSLISSNLFSINLLPILMLIINFISNNIISKHLSNSEKIKANFLSLIFFIFLYNSSSGLVLFWTLYNCFLLFSNIGLNSSSPKNFFIKSISFISLVLFIPILINIILFPFIYPKIKLYVLILSLIIILSIFIYKKFNLKINQFLSKEPDFNLFIYSCIALFIWIGYSITTNTIVSSPSEFSYVGSIKSPFEIINNTASQALGLFVIFPLLLFFCANVKIKNILMMFFLILLSLSIFNSLMFVDVGILSVDLRLNIDGLKLLTPFNQIINFILCIVVSLLTLVLFIKNKDLLKKTIILICITSIPSIMYNSFLINSEFQKIKKSVEQSNKMQTSKSFHSTNKNDSIAQKVITLSKNGQNVLIIFIDRAISSFVPEIFEDSNISNNYTGFTYYPNTVSFFPHTLLGYPPMIAGYEYTPDNLNKRTNEKMVDKYNEALLMLPLMFKNNGFVSTVIEPPFENFQWTVKDGKIFNAKGINHHVIDVSENKKYEKDIITKILKRNFLYFNMFVVAPACMKKHIYLNGDYKKIPPKENQGIWDEYLVNEYYKFTILDKLTEIVDDKQNYFTVFNSGIMHINLYVDGQVNEHFNMEKDAFIMLSKYFKFLKDNNVYNNTRIIIVSDHGHWGQTNNHINIKYTAYHPILLVKDFNKSFYFKKDMTFMTNADTSIIATDNIISNPINPFSKQDIRKFVNKDKVRIYTDKRNTPGLFEGASCLEKGLNYLEVSDNIFDDNNWSSGKL